jgi:cytidine deaminase
MTTEQEQQLINAAFEGMKNAYTIRNKENDFRVGSAVLTKSGNIYSSGSYYSLTLSLTLHCEQACLAHAAAHGEYEIEAIASVSNDPEHEIMSPCGMCKQLLYESQLRSGVPMTILFINNKTKQVDKRMQLDEMIVCPWPEK